MPRQNQIHSRARSSHLHNVMKLRCCAHYLFCCRFVARSVVSFRWICVHVRAQPVHICVWSRTVVCSMRAENKCKKRKNNNCIRFIKMRICCCRHCTAAAVIDVFVACVHFQWAFCNRTMRTSFRWKCKKPRFFGLTVAISRHKWMHLQTWNNVGNAYAAWLHDSHTKTHMHMHIDAHTRRYAPIVRCTDALAS